MSTGNPRTTDQPLQVIVSGRGGRAANGRSSIHRDSDGRWHGYVSMGRAGDGRVVRRHVRGQTRTEVSEKVTALEEERARSAGRPTVSQRLTVGEWLDEWLVIVQRTRKPKTFDNYTSLLRAHCSVLRRQTLVRVSVRDIDDLLHRISLDAPCRRILAAATTQPNSARWSVALALGLRQGEALGLQWRDIDSDEHRLVVRRQVQRLCWHHGCAQSDPDHLPARCPTRTGGGWTFEDVKSRAGRRTLAIPDQLLAQLQSHRHSQAEHRLTVGPAWHEHDLVFPRPDGLPQHPTVDAQAWRRLTESAGVPRLRLHYARHTTATMLLAQGVDGRVVMALLGWSQSSLLARYQHVLDPMRRDAAQRIDSAYWPAAGSD